MRVVFVGASKFGLRCLEQVIQLPGIEVAGIITNPEIFTISYRPTGVRNVLHTNFRPLAEQYHIPIWMMTGKMSDPDLVAQVRSWQPDFILVVGWYHMVPGVIRNIAPAAGLHASLLPDYSGGAPLVWAIINDEPKTGITFFIMDEGVDSGPIIGQAETPIYFEDTIATLYTRIEEAGLRLLQEHLPRIVRGEAAYTLQDESKRRTVPQRSPDDGQINWNWPARQIYNFIRAQTKPYPGAFTYWGQEKITIWKASLADIPNKCVHPAGTVVADLSNIPETFGVTCGDERVLWVHEIGLADGTTLNGVEFIKKLMPDYQGHFE